MDMAMDLAIVGTWNFRDPNKGIAVFRYDRQTGNMEPLEHIDHWVSAGQQCFDHKRNVLYLVDECDGKPDTRGGGGFARAYHVDPETGKLTFLNEIGVLMTKPAYICLNSTGEYALVACHTGGNPITKVARDGAGNWFSTVMYEDAGIVLLHLNSDGSFDRVSDVVLHDGWACNAKVAHAHLHSIVASPDGELFYACDKGLDRVYAYKIHHASGKLLRMTEQAMPPLTAPRYSVFHPTLPVLYENNETSPEVYAFRYDPKSGALEIINAVNTYAPEENGSPSDLQIHPSGKYLYAAVRKLNKLVVLRTDDQTGAVTIIQEVDNPGAPRGMAVSPDGRFLLVANNDTACVCRYAIAEDGRLTLQEGTVSVPNAANIGILFFE